jgi:glucose-6-phosphate 1-epimerase
VSLKTVSLKLCRNENGVTWKTMNMSLPNLGELVLIRGADGSTATVALHGGQVVSWCTADRTERLFVSSLATTLNGAAIRGGVPICFPQFASLGDLPKHGFARTSQWRFDGGSRFSLVVGANTWPGWIHSCRLVLDVTLGPSSLTLSLTVENVSEEGFEFTIALHTYLLCDDVRGVSVNGLDGCVLHGAAELGDRMVGAVKFGDGVSDVDLAFLAVTTPIQAFNVPCRERVTYCAQTGFPDAVVWNIGQAKAVAMTDLGPDEWLKYVCIESAAIGEPIALSAGQRWTGTQTLLVNIDNIGEAVPNRSGSTS